MVAGKRVESKEEGLVAEARDRHQRRTFILAAAVLASVLAAVVLAVATAADLNQYRALRFPLGFYLLAQGLLIVIVAVSFWFSRRQEQIDEERDESEGL
jgi:putative solute:sodium symporter small subunit